jgi:hypothetical protein
MSAKACSMPGLTGLDWVAEHRYGRDAHTCVTSLADLVYSKQSFWQGALGAGGRRRTRASSRRRTLTAR